MVHRGRILLIAAFAALAAGCAQAASPVPPNGVISEPGYYYLTASRLSASSPVVVINAADVDLDLNGWYVRCAPPNPGASSSIGISVSGHHVTIRNGSITGCFMGVAGGADMLTVHSVDFSGNTYIGIHGGGRGTKIIGSVFQAIGGYQLEAYAIGIHNPGRDCLIERNTFREIVGQPVHPPGMAGEGVGILLSTGTTGCVIRGNWMANGGASDSIGIWLAGGTSAYIAENSITNFGDGAIRGAPVSATVINNRLWMGAPWSGSWAIGGQNISAKGNLIVGFEIPIGFLAIDAGGNLILP